MNKFLVILLLPLLVSVQSLASVCLAKCSLQDLVPVKITEKMTDHQGCHQSQANSEEDESSDESHECGSICQLNELIKSDIIEASVHQNTETISHLSSIYLLSSLKNPIYQKTISESPPGFRPYLGVALFIQKSSFLI